MKILNSLVKAFLRVGIYLMLFVYCFFFAFLISNMLLGTCCTFMSIVTVLPNQLMTKYWLVSLSGSAPITLAFFIISIVKTNKK